MDFRKIFDTIPEQFEKWRPRYCGELFSDVIEYAGIKEGKTILEIGPGTGQATEPFLKTGCPFIAIELGENFAGFLERKFSAYKNFTVINADFETYDFGGRKFDLIFSAAAIQWIPERIAFPKVYSLLNNGGSLAMFATRSDYKTPNEELFDKIQDVYSRFFNPETVYAQKMDYKNALNYGFTAYDYREYRQTREFDADGYASFIGTHSDHLTLREPDKTAFYAGIKAAINGAGGKITVNDTITLHLVKKPRQSP